MSAANNWKPQRKSARQLLLEDFVRPERAKTVADASGGHTVRHTFELGWATKRNGELLALAEEAGFDMLVTTDQNLQHQQNLKAFKLAVFILGRGNWPQIRPFAAWIVARIGAIATPGVYFFPIPP